VVNILTKRLRHRIKYILWVLNGRIGKPYSLDTHEKLSVLLTCFHPVRMAHLDAQIRNILKCSFVEKIVISNHNPEIRIQERVSVRNDRLVFLNQQLRRGCGHRWLVARELDREHILVLDDDLLLFPSQVKHLFKHLLLEPEVPHGYAGMNVFEDNGYEYHESAEMNVKFLCEVYAVTKRHVRRYVELHSILALNSELSEILESSVDFMLISQCGNRNPKIHKKGRLFRCSTHHEPGIAVHKRAEFEDNMSTLSSALGSRLNQRTAQSTIESKHYQEATTDAKS
jgi:hypothetical protein